ncbi:MAG: glycosyltransferase family 1 protein [Candidatus Promineifilaceae bacterium]
MTSQRSSHDQVQRPVVGIDVTSALSQRAGIGRYTRELVSALVRNDKSTEYLLFSAKQPSWDPLVNRIPPDSNVRYKQSLFSERWLYRIWHRLRLPVPVQLFTGDIDLFYSPDFVLPPVRDNIPTVLTVHDLSFIHYPETFTPSLRKYLNQVVPRSVRSASHVLADSRTTKEDISNIWHIDEKKITVLYSGVDRAFRPPSDNAQLVNVRKKYDLGEEPYIFSVSTIQPRKNYQMLIRAFKDVANDFPHRLVIAGGKGWLYEETLAEVNAQGLTDKVRFVGFVDDADLPALYSDATLFVFPSLYEGFGLPILEAMACGVPVVVSNASCMPEVAGEAALVLSPQDQEAWTTAIRDLLDDPSRRAQMVAGGFLRARQFKWKRAAEQLSGLVKQLLPNG